MTIKALSESARFGRVSKSNHDLRVDVIVGVNGLDSLRENWEALIASDSNASSFVSWNWVQSWISVYGKGRELVTIVCRQGSSIVGIFPFSYQKNLSPLSLRKLWMLGFQSGLGSNGLTEEPVMAIVCKPEVRELVLSALHRKLKQLTLEGPWDVIAYRRFGRGIEDCSMLEVEKTLTVVQQYHRGCEYVQLPETWELYLKTISKSMRENISYYHRKFIKAGIDYSVESVPTDQVDAVLEVMVSLHKKRTYLDSSLAHVDYFANPKQKALFQVALKAMIPTGEAKLVLLRANSKIIAVQVFLRSDQMLMAHYSGFDPEYGGFSPLFVLQTQVIKEAIESGCPSLNLLRGNASWQRRWGASPTNQIIDITLAKRRALSRLRQAICLHEANAVNSIICTAAVQKARAAYELRQISQRIA